MQITIEYMLQFLGELLRQGGTAEEKVRLVEAFYNAALKHVNDVQNDLYDDEENEKEKRTKKEKEKEAGEAPLNPLAREASNKPPGYEKLPRMTPEEVRRKIDPEFLEFIEEKWLLPKYRALMTLLPTPLTGAQYLSWLTRYPRELIDQKLTALEVNPTHYGRVSVPGTINDWLRQDDEKMTFIMHKQWLDVFRQQQPMILEMINQHLKPKRNAKQTTIDFDAADAAAAAARTAPEPADGDPAAVHTADDGRQPGLPDA